MYSSLNEKPIYQLSKALFLKSEALAHFCEQNEF